MPSCAFSRSAIFWRARSSRVGARSLVIIDGATWSTIITGRSASAKGEGSRCQARAGDGEGRHDPAGEQQVVRRDAPARRATDGQQLQQIGIDHARPATGRIRRRCGSRATAGLPARSAPAPRGGGNGTRPSGPTLHVPPCAAARGGGAVIRDGGVGGNATDAHDPSVAVRRRHLPSFAREEKKRRGRERVMESRIATSSGSQKKSVFGRKETVSTLRVSIWSRRV